MRFADIAVNLADPMFTGTYHGKNRHVSDLTAVVERAKSKGVERILITGTSLQDSKDALELARRYDLHCTAGIHPTSTSSIPTSPSELEAHYSSLEDLLQTDSTETPHQRRIRAVGEIGLDYDRLHFSPKSTQLTHLPRLLQLGRRFRLPLFLHSRTNESHLDLIRLLREAGWPEDGNVGWESGKEWVGGVVHSFTGTREQVGELVKLGLYIGINGCSLKTPDNLEMIKSIPLDRLMLETDAPWCSITSSHASHAHLPPPPSDLYIDRVNKPEKWKPDHGVKGRQEPADIAIIAHVVASVRGESVESVAEAAWTNSCSLFWPEAR